ncbi:MAG: cytochrome b N-terminal domain-containing protein [Acidobacteria bacterium]|nr:cytochrome b N-terminal domain-containing protein [Acidobacteriota bacterium]
MWTNLRELPANVWRSLFRNPIPSSDLERASTSFTNFFLHIHPVKVHRNTLRPLYSMGLGLISFFLFLILTVTGVLLMFYYVPSTTQAYDRMLDLRGTVAFGIFLRNMHRWSAHGMVGVVVLHMCRVFFTGSHKQPREFNWVVGVLLFLLTLFSSFTGYLLPWDQLAFWAITVGTAIAGYAPVIGKQVQFLLLGDTTVGQEALLRFYVLHVAVLPLVMALLVAIHFWRIRKDGGLSRPEEPAAALAAPGETPVAVLSLAFDAPLEEPVNVMHPPNPAKAPWYFLGLQEMVSYSAFWGGVGIPTIFVLLLLAAPYLERGSAGVGKWFARERLLANTVFLTFALINVIFVIIGTFFRGPNWEFISPFK